MNKAILICLLALAGCATSNPPAAPAVLRLPPADAMQPCGDLDQPSDGTLASVYRAAVSAGHKYAECRARHQQLIDWAAK